MSQGAVRKDVGCECVYVNTKVYFCGGRSMCVCMWMCVHTHGVQVCGILWSPAKVVNA